MALGIFDVTKKPATPLTGGRAEVVKKLTFDTDYPTGGYPLTAALLGLSSVEYVSCNGTGGFVCEYDYAASKLKVLTGDNDAGADGPLIEVAAGLNAIDTLTTRVLARGVAL